MPPATIAVASQLRAFEAARSGDREETLAQVETAEAEAARDRPGWAQFMALAVPLAILRELGDVELAEQKARTAKARLDAWQTGPWMAHSIARIHIGLILLEAGHADEALPELERALDHHEKHDVTTAALPHVAWLHVGLSKALTALGREPERARALPEEAIRIHDRLPNPRPKERAQARAWLDERPKSAG